ALAWATRNGSPDANVTVPFAQRDGRFGVDDDGPLSGRIVADIPSLKATGNQIGPSYLLGGRAAQKLTVAGTPVKPNLAG
ncbi:hypothetical protein, partial [Burkholderia sp. GbtcB21]|uniref:hypothetical protein n=1 Tax=Burkholderia sp. GbtcB21 TaxID=2824766 RepID=UPI001C2FF013